MIGVCGHRLAPGLATVTNFDGSDWITLQTLPDVVGRLYPNSGNELDAEGATLSKLCQNTGC